MSLSQFLAILLARKWMIIGAVCASLIGAAIVIMVVPPRYTADTRVLLDIIKPDPVTGQVMNSQFARAYTQTQTQLIKDSRVAGKVVDDIGWTRDPVMIARYAVPGDPNGARRRLAQIIIDHTNAGLIEGSNIMEISYTGWSPDSARTIADALRRDYIDAAVQTKRDSAAASADWYQSQADKAQRLLTMAENTKADFERAHGLVMEDDKTDIDTQRLSALSSVAPSTAVAPVTPSIPAASPSATELASVDAQLAQASRTLGANNPVLIQLREKRTALAAQVAQDRAASGAAVAAAGRASGAANAAAGAVARELEAQKARVLANSENLAQLRQLQNQVDVRRDQFTKLTQAAAQLRSESTTDDAGVTVLSNAVAPDSPSFPNVPLVLLGAISLGVVIGLLAALLTELLNRRIRTPRDVEDLLEGIPLLAVIAPASSRPNKGWLKALRTSRSAEESLVA